MRRCLKMRSKPIRAACSAHLILQSRNHLKAPRWSWFRSALAMVFHWHLRFCMNYSVKMDFHRVPDQMTVMNDHHSPKNVGSPFLPTCLIFVFFSNSLFVRSTSSSAFTSFSSSCSFLTTSGNSKVSPLKLISSHSSTEFLGNWDLCSLLRCIGGYFCTGLG